MSSNSKSKDKHFQERLKPSILAADAHPGESRSESRTHGHDGDYGQMSEDEFTIWQHVKYLKSADTAVESAVSINPRDTKRVQQTTQLLDESTTRIQQHIRILEAQVKAKQNINRYETSRDLQRQAFKSLRDRQKTAELQHMTFNNDDRHGNLSNQLRDEQSHLDKAIKIIPSIVIEKLNTHDRVLEQSQKLIDKESAVFDEKSESRRVEALLKVLHETKSEVLKDRLDLVYLETLRGADSEPLTHDEKEYENEADAVETLQRDIKSLYDEIEDVMTMVVAAEHGIELQHSLDTFRRTKFEYENARNKAIKSRLTHLQTDLDRSTKEFRALYSERLVRQEVAQHLDHLRPPQQYQAPGAPRKKPLGGVTVTDDTKPTRQAYQALINHLEVYHVASADQHASTGTDAERADDAQALKARTVRQLSQAAADRKTAIDLLRDSPGTDGSNNILLDDQLRELEKQINEVKVLLEREARFS